MAMREMAVELNELIETVGNPQAEVLLNRLLQFGR